MSKKTTEPYEGTKNKGIEMVSKQPLPEPIYDHTTADESKMVKAAGPGERGDEE